MKEPKHQKRYSEAFKLRLIEELKTGKWASICAMSRAYNISNATINGWLIRYGHEHLLNRSIYVDTADEKSEIKQLKEELKNAKLAMQEMAIEYFVERAIVNILCEKTNTTRDEIKKKLGEQSSRK